MKRLRFRINALAVSLFLSGFLSAQTPPLADIYARGPIQLKNTAGFGERTEIRGANICVLPPWGSMLWLSPGLPMISFFV